LTTAVRLVRAATPLEWAQARRLIEAYAESLGVDLCFQNFDQEIEHLPGHYGPPRGAMLLAVEGEEVLGCVGLRPHDESTGEVKRLYVTPGARGRDIGRTLALGVVQAAREHGYRRLVLDTLPSMHAAQALYGSLGFRPIDAYRHNPVPGAAFMELTLNAPNAV